MTLQHIMLPFKAKFSCNTLVSLQRVFNTHMLRQMLPTFWFIANSCLRIICIWQCVFSQVVSWQKVFSTYFLRQMASAQWFHYNEYSAHWQCFVLFFHAMLLSHCCFMAKFLFRHIGFMAIPFFSTLVSWQLHF